MRAQASVSAAPSRLNRAAAVREASIELVLSRLDRVKRAGSSWTARCPAHEDHNASLSVTAGTDGRVLLHCFAGCSVYDVVAAIGLTIHDLFPRRLTDASPMQWKELRDLTFGANVRAAAGVLFAEATVVLIAAGDIARGRGLTEDDHERLATAVDRVEKVRAIVGGVL